MKARLLAGAALVAVCAASGAWRGRRLVWRDRRRRAQDAGPSEIPVTDVTPSLQSFRVKTDVNVAAFARIGYQFMRPLPA